MEVYAKERKEYLTSILMKDKSGESPLEITIKNDYSKNTEILLTYLNTFPIEYSFSRLFYHHFYLLLEMNLSSFHEYLDKCIFKTD